jgi:hypothetical protein
MTFVSTSTNGRSYQIGSNFSVGAGEFAVYDLTAAANRLVIDSSGRVLAPFQPAFFAGLSATFAHPSGVAKIAGTFTATVNIGSGFNTSTQRFTAPVSGTYYLSACVGTNSGGGTFSYLSSEVWVNGSRRIIGGWDGGGSAYGKTSTSGVVYLNASDYVELYCEASKAFTVEGNSSSTFLSGHLVG